ncbi:uncharacterized protein LOC134239793 [Saccostrea cucullata]|uniref:uncharacterized protein LOC134239793 n=1 Tax=Saccostrea cuccullata TaxID=36930 RepID=UPI002ED23414
MGKIDDKTRPSDALLRGFTSSSNDNDSEYSQDPLRLKLMKKLQNHGIQAESGTPSNLVRTESSPVEHLMGQMLDNQRGTLDVLVRGNRTEVSSPCIGISGKTENQLDQGMKIKSWKTRLEESFSGMLPASVKPNLPGPTWIKKVHPDLAIIKFVQGIRKYLSKEHGKVHICRTFLKNLMAATVMCTKLFDTKWGFITFGFFMCLLFSTAGSTEVTEECLMSTIKTIRKASKCPTNRSDWDKAANLMNCQGLVPSQCTTLKYHCVMNGFGNETIEVCAVPKYIQPGYCAEFNKLGKKIQNHRHFYPKGIKKVYISTDIYKYPQCYENVQKTTKRPSTETMSVTKPSHTTVSPAQTTPRAIWRSEDSDSTSASDRKFGLIGILLGIVLPIIVFGLLICKYRRKRGQGDSSEREAFIEENVNEQRDRPRTQEVNGVGNNKEDGTATHARNEFFHSNGHPTICWWRAANLHLCSALSAIEQLEIFIMSEPNAIR